MPSEIGFIAVPKDIAFCGAKSLITLGRVQNHSLLDGALRSSLPWFDGIVLVRKQLLGCIRSTKAAFNFRVLIRLVNYYDFRSMFY